MIRFLHGTVQSLHEKEVVLLTSGGVGYQIFPAGSLLASLKKDEVASVQITTIVKETEISLYGFADRDEMELFEKLISVSGIGPKTALQMVSIPVSQFLQAIENGDVPLLTKIPGLGKKTAERLIIELRGKIDLSNQEMATPQSATHREATQALENLGYDKNSIRDILSQAPSDATAEDLVKFFLSSHM